MPNARFSLNKKLKHGDYDHLKATIIVDEEVTDYLDEDHDDKDNTSEFDAELHIRQ